MFDIIGGNGVGALGQCVDDRDVVGQFVIVDKRGNAFRRVVDSRWDNGCSRFCRYARFVSLVAYA